MQTKFNIGDTVLIKGTIRRIEITREGEIYYDVENGSDVLGAYGYNRVQESEIERLEESKEDIENGVVKETKSTDLALFIHHNILKD